MFVFEQRICGIFFHNTNACIRYKQAVLQHRETDTKLKSLRLNSKEREAEFEKTEDDLKALQSVGQIIGEVLRQIDDERFIVKASSGPRYVRHKFTMTFAFRSMKW